MARMYKRLPCDQAAGVKIDPGGPGERICLFKTVNISMTGALFESELPVSPGTPVRVYFYLRSCSDPGKKDLRVDVSGKVARSGPGGLAVEFDELLAKYGATTEGRKTE